MNTTLSGTTPRSARLRGSFRRAGIASAAVAAIALAGCSSSGSQTSAGGSGPVTASSASSAPGAAAKLVPSQFKGGVTVATSQGYPPTDFVGSDGKTTGFDYDLGQALAQKLGIRFKFEETTFAAIIPGILAKKFDIVMDDMDDLKAREATMTFVDYFQTGASLVIPKADAGHIRNLTDLCGKAVAVTQGTTLAGIAVQASATCTKDAKQSITVNQLATGADDLLEIRSGKADAQIDDTNTAGYSVHQSNGAFALVPLPQIPPAIAGIGMAGSNAALAKAIQAGLQELMADGTYKKLLAAYGLTADAVSSPTINGASS
jgi:polar amino acid transport system substrate-binding protein